MSEFFRRLVAFANLRFIAYPIFVPLIACLEGVKVIFRHTGSMCRIDYLVLALLAGWVICGILWGFARAVTKHSDKQALLFFILSLVVFFYHSIEKNYERVLVYFLNSTNQFWFSGYLFFLLSGIAVGASFILIKKIKSSLRPVNNYLFFVLLFFVLIRIVTLTEKYATIQSIGLLAPPKLQKLETASTDQKKLPDIYYIVADAYTSSLSLEKYFGKKNSLDSVLKLKKFYIADRSRANYHVTYPSLASSLNLSYLDLEPGSRIGYSGRESLKSQIRESLLFKFLQECGYSNVYLSHIFENEKRISPLKENPEIISYTSFYSRSLFYFLVQYFIEEQAMKEPTKNDILNYVGYSHYLHNESIYKALLEEIAKPQTTNKFVYAHFMNVHAPFVFDQKGKYKNESFFDATTQNYMVQVDQLNSRLMHAINALLGSGDRNAIVLIQGDHGSHMFGSYFYGESETYDIQNAYYFPDLDYNLLYKDISPVNSFRVILNKYFHQSLPLLADKEVSVNY